MTCVERQIVSGRAATVVYSNDKLDPFIDKRTATKMRVVFDDGGVVFARRSAALKEDRSIKAWVILRDWDESEHPRDRDASALKCPDNDAETVAEIKYNIALAEEVLKEREQ
jgi:hypothetical protein